ncbi:hypothetical protein F511_03972 [Dorcoceras hygrometricum]|uniref:Uncharacterized protein n=1 Tax=Dorcoceras hygrometricum TaxID=472368 RepID=A0A2Z7B1U8_9LAMI|nr:hypothetical protein F511_03972 [Dorcoceras hygrometricum]
MIATDTSREKSIARYILRLEDQPLVERITYPMRRHLVKWMRRRFEDQSMICLAIDFSIQSTGCLTYGMEPVVGRVLRRRFVCLGILRCGVRPADDFGYLLVWEIGGVDWFCRWTIVELIPVVASAIYRKTCVKVRIRACITARLWLGRFVVAGVWNGRACWLCPVEDCVCYCVIAVLHMFICLRSSMLHTRMIFHSSFVAFVPCCIAVVSYQDARASGNIALSSPCRVLIAPMRRVANYHNS